ncbi:MAG: DUF4126 domain-containing protein [Myxococcota bacterium]|nr:DUF4126 domain-containing protein [Myxococcota bacterium]
MEYALAITLGLVLAASAGLRAFLPLLVVSGLAFAGQIELADSLAWMGSPVTLLALLVGVLGEVLADKIPAIDHLMDTVGTLARPTAGALAGASLLAGADPLIVMVMGVAAGGAVAGATHIGKASVRAGSSATTLGMANPVISGVEDLIALALGSGAAVAAVAMA